MFNSKSLTWNPDEMTLDRMNHSNYYVSFKAFRRSSTRYVNKKYVREFVMNKYNNKCIKCESSKYLQIDHKVSVHESFLKKKYYECNSLNNLQLLCEKCNIKKSNK